MQYLLGIAKIFLTARGLKIKNSLKCLVLDLRYTGFR